MFHVRYILSKDFHIELYKIIKQNSNTKNNIFSFLEQANTTEAKEHLVKLEVMRNEINSTLNIWDKYYTQLDKDYYRIFDLIENAIIILSKKEALFSCLEEIASRNEFNLKELATPITNYKRQGNAHTPEKGLLFIYQPLPPS